LLISYLRWFSNLHLQRERERVWIGEEGVRVVKYWVSEKWESEAFRGFGLCDFGANTGNVFSFDRICYHTPTVLLIRFHSPFNYFFILKLIVIYFHLDFAILNIIFVCSWYLPFHTLPLYSSLSLFWNFSFSARILSLISGIIRSFSSLRKSLSSWKPYPLPSTGIPSHTLSLKLIELTFSFMNLFFCAVVLDGNLPPYFNNPIASTFFLLLSNQNPLSPSLHSLALLPHLLMVLSFSHFFVFCFSC